MGETLVKTLFAVFALVAVALGYFEHVTHAYRVHRLTGAPLLQVIVR